MTAKDLIDYWKIGADDAWTTQEDLKEMTSGNMVQKTILTDTPKKLIKKYRQILIQNKIKVDKIILFGSYAKGTAKPWSDLDLCVVSKQFGKDANNELSFLNRLTLGVDPMIEPHPYHPKDLADYYDPLAHEINKTGKVIL